MPISGIRCYNPIVTMMKIAICIIAVLLVTLTVSAATEKVSLNATGYEWLGYSKEYKNAFVGLLYAIYGIDKNKNPTDDIIKRLDDFYNGAFKEAKSRPFACRRGYVFKNTLR